ncbi:VirB4 family type IV secretion/conjugal transfer ATPase [Tabrizicola oligotrophica]|uniref:Type IV secretion system protein B4 n=1 Tax=Tabrizicola oligotrophica TaxID=2710650 RepID=A0A6M0QZP2_9RHOB|nr:type IV secretion system protein B4 [Tabrizicola oligotrophica]NEY92022.1 type IV secretion system protein B4 [Tabrizicola oligotrophica]
MCPDLAGPQLSARAKSVQRKDRKLHAHLPYLVEVDDEVVRSRDNALMLSLEISGIDGFTAAPQSIAALRSQLAQLLDGLDDRFTFYIHRMMKKAEVGLRPLIGQGFAADIEAAWRNHLAANDPQDFVLVITIVRRQQVPLKVPFFARAARRAFAEDTQRRLEALREVTSILETGLGIATRRLKVSDGSLIGFYSALTSGLLRPEFRGRATLIAEDAANVSVSFHKGHVQIHDGAGETRYAAVIHVRNYATATWPGMLDALDASIGTIIAHSYTPIDRNTISERARRKTAQMKAADDMAVSIERQLYEAADAVESGLMGFGDHQMTITVFAESLRQLDEQVARIRGIGHQAGFRLEREVFGLPATFFAMHPGNMDYRMRVMTVASTNFADMAAFHAADTGSKAANLPWGTPITAFEAVQGSLHRFSFHEPGDPNSEPTVGHTLVLGRSGGGKTTTVAFLVAQAQRARIRTILFDKEAGLKMAVTALGGRYAEIKAGQPTGLNPLATETGERGEAWLLDWFSALLDASGARLTPQQSDELKRAIRQNANVPVALRNFRDFQTLLGDVGDGRDLAMRVGEWGPDGRYAWVFGPAAAPVVDFAAQDITAVDLTEILDLKTERTAVLAYLFRRIEMLIEEKRPTLIVIDEAWKVLDDDYFSAKLAEWLVTARKKNVVVVMMTQFPSQIRQSRARSVLEALPNQLLFPNPEADGRDYEDFRLTEGELGFVLSGEIGRRLVLCRSARGSTVLDVDLKALGPLITVLGGGRAGQAAFGDDYGSRPKFWKE